MASRYMEQGYKALNQRYLLTAINFFKRALAESPGNDEAHAAVGTCYLLAKNYKEALKYFSEALNINPKNASALESMAIVYENLGNAMKAREYAQRASGSSKDKTTFSGKPFQSGIEIIARRKRGEQEDDRILACPFCGSLFFRNNIDAWLAEYGKCPTCAQVLSPSQLIKKDWNTYKNERCSIDMIRFDMKR